MLGDDGDDHNQNLGDHGGIDSFKCPVIRQYSVSVVAFHVEHLYHSSLVDVVLEPRQGFRPRPGIPLCSWYGRRSSLPPSLHIVQYSTRL